MNGCPPKPGLTVMISSESILPRYGFTCDIRVGGLIASPTFLPRDLIRHNNGVTWSPNSTCTVIWSTPALAKGSSKISGREHIKCTSRNIRVSGRRTRATSGPKEMLGTKCPSMISRCSHRAPALSTRIASAASLPKFAASNDGAIIMRRA